MPALADGIYLILKKAGKLFVSVSEKIQHELSCIKKINWLK